LLRHRNAARQLRFSRTAQCKMWLYRSSRHCAQMWNTPMSIDGSTAKTFRIPAGFWAIVSLVLWSLAVTALIDRTPYGLDEATAHAVLFLWSIADAVASPIVTLGIPDVRAVFLIPAGAIFSGSLLAVKLCTLVVVLALAIGLFRWQRAAGNAEPALPATGLLLLSPLTLTAIDHLAIGPFLALSFVLGALADRGYRAGRIRFGGTYFAQLFLILAAISLHPAGLAYPAMLALGWLRSPPTEPPVAALIPGTERTHVLAGIAVATVLGLLLAHGWPHQDWLGNPLTALPQGIFAFQAESALGINLIWLVGAVLALALGSVVVAVVRAGRAQPQPDLLARTLGLGTLIAAASADASYVFLALVLLLHWGYPVLLRLRLGRRSGFIAQRGAAFVLLVLVSTIFLSADRNRFEQVRAGPELSAQDQLIRALTDTLQQAHPEKPQPGLVTEEEKARSGPRVASQWPGRTMIACRCSTLPLPPASDDQELFLANLKGTEYVIFDPLSPVNRNLSRSFATLGGARAETVSLQAGGVLLRLHPETKVPNTEPPLAPSIQG
jgi:hypothetical protein